MVDEGLMKGLGAQGPFGRVVKVSGYSGRDRTCQSRLTNRTSETTLSRNLFRVGHLGTLQVSIWHVVVALLQVQVVHSFAFHLLPWGFNNPRYRQGRLSASALLNTSALSMPVWVGAHAQSMHRGGFGGGRGSSGIGEGY